MKILRYPIIIEKAARNYSAFSPDLPGCVATGRTLEQTIKNMERAIQLHIQGLQEDGLPIPKPSCKLTYEVNSHELLTGVEVTT
jgi:predicted RNase H-like HicB family nuclease